MDEFLKSHPEVNFLQSGEWGDAHEKLGFKIIKTPTWQGIVKNARRGRYLEVPGAPLIDWQNSNEVSKAVDELAGCGRENDCVFVRVRPQVEDNESIRLVLSRAGLKKAPMHLHAEHTSLLDISHTEEELLNGMRRQTRYEVRRGQKLGIKVSYGNSETDFDRFHAVQQETAKRQGFIPPSREFLRALRDAFGDAVRVYRAELNGQLLNLAVVIHFGLEADYFEAASTPEARSLPGAYSLLWQSILDAKQAGLVRYNLWGVAYSENPQHRYAGVTTFKRGFGGEDVTYVPAHDLVLKKGRYTLNWAIETARKKKRKL